MFSLVVLLRVLQTQYGYQVESGVYITIMLTLLFLGVLVVILRVLQAWAIGKAIKGMSATGLEELLKKK